MKHLNYSVLTEIPKKPINRFINLIIKKISIYKRFSVFSIIYTILALVLISCLATADKSGQEQQTEEHKETITITSEEPEQEKTIISEIQ